MRWSDQMCWKLPSWKTGNRMGFEQDPPAFYGTYPSRQALLEGRNGSTHRGAVKNGYVRFISCGGGFIASDLVFCCAHRLFPKGQQGEKATAVSAISRRSFLGRG
jgi:hypothetical protein